MKKGKINTYLTDRLANLLNAHGPQDAGERGLAGKLKYIVPAWDAILRDEKKRWRASLDAQEWFVLQSCTISHSFAMEYGGAWETDVGAILACVEDMLGSELCMDNPEKWRSSTVAKLRGASVSSDLALVWMLLRERKRVSK